MTTSCRHVVWALDTESQPFPTSPAGYVADIQEMSGSDGSIRPLACAVRLLVSELGRDLEISALEIRRAVHWSGIHAEDSGHRSNRLQGDQHQRLFTRTHKVRQCRRGGSAPHPA